MGRSIEQRLQALEDREEIIKLKARYVNYNDGGWNGPTHASPQAVADMFVEDGVWDGAPNSGYAKGRAQIKDLFDSFAVVPFIVHYVTNPVIDVDGDAATGHWHALVTATLPGPQAIWILGLYKDEYVRCPDGWKFKTLRFDTIASTDWRRARQALRDPRSRRKAANFVANDDGRAAGFYGRGIVARKASASFLKKRSKKLFGAVAR